MEVQNYQNQLAKPMLGYYLGIINGDPTASNELLIWSQNEIIYYTATGKIKWQYKQLNIKKVEVKKFLTDRLSRQIKVYIVTKDNNNFILLDHRGLVLNFLEEKVKKYCQYYQGLNNFNPTLLKTTKQLIFFALQEKGDYKLTFKLENSQVSQTNFLIFLEDNQVIYQTNKLENTFEIKYTVLEQKIALYAEFTCELKLINIQKLKQEAKLYFIGDSIIANQNEKLLFGIGQVWPLHYAGLSQNYAMMGHSLKSFIYEGRFNYLLNKVKNNDLVIISFGHNDQKLTDYGENLQEFEFYLTYVITKLQEFKVKCVLLNSIPRRCYQKGKLIDTHQEYKDIPQVIAIKLGIQFINLHKYLEKILLEHTIQQSKRLYGYYKELALFDNTHLSFLGANLVAEKLNLEIKKALIKGEK